MEVTPCLIGCSAEELEGRHAIERRGDRLGNRPFVMSSPLSKLFATVPELICAPTSSEKLAHLAVRSENQAP